MFYYIFHRNPVKQSNSNFLTLSSVCFLHEFSQVLQTHNKEHFALDAVLHITGRSTWGSDSTCYRKSWAMVHHKNWMHDSKRIYGAEGSGGWDKDMSSRKHTWSALTATWSLFQFVFFCNKTALFGLVDTFTVLLSLFILSLDTYYGKILSGYEFYENV